MVLVGGGRDFPSPVETGPSVHPASCTTGTGSFLGVRLSERGVGHPPTSVAKIIELYLPLGPRGLLYLYLTYLCQRESNSPVEWNLIGLRVFTQQYTSSTFVTWRYRSHKKQLGAR